MKHINKLKNKRYTLKPSGTGSTITNGNSAYG